MAINAINKFHNIKLKKMAKHNYIDKWTCIGMMNKNCSLVQKDGLLSFNKTKNASKAVAFSLDYKFDPLLHKQVSWLYLDDCPDREEFDSIYSLEEIVSVIEPSRWFWQEDHRPACALAGKSFIEWRGTINKWCRLQKEKRFTVESLSYSNLDETLQMVEEWRYLGNGGMKYGWQERAGCDKALVQRFASNYEGIQGYVVGSVFRLDGAVVGYSCIEKAPMCNVDGIPEVKYLTRKVLSTIDRRNITEYIDYKTIELVHQSNQDLKQFLVNWGASSGGVHWYKTHKFPVYSLETKWFASKKAK